MHRLKVFIFVCAVTYTFYSSSLVGKTVPRDITFYGLNQDIKILKFASVSIEKITLQNERIQLGSGCLISIAGGNLFVLTCNHVISDLSEDDKLVVGVNSSDGKVLCFSNVAHIDTSLDLALLSITGMVAPERQFPQEIKQAPLDTSIFASEDEIQEGLGVLIIGFPLGIGAGPIINYPISRFGIIAQKIPGHPLFLIDGTASSGNSGSPVFFSSLCAERAPKFLGIVMGFPADRITAFDENKNLILSLPYNSGLVYCISAPAIKKFITMIERELK